MLTFEKKFEQRTNFTKDELKAKKEKEGRWKRKNLLSITE